MKVAMILTDEREELHQYDKEVPFFGPAPTALLQGLKNISGCEIHIISCVKKRVYSPEKIFQNIYYHSIEVKQWGWLRSGYMGCVLAIKSKLRELNPDLVHGQGTERYCALAAVFSGLPNIITIHGNMRQLANLYKSKPFTYPWLAAKLEQYAIYRTNGIICLSSHTANTVKHKATNTWILPNAVNPDFFNITMKTDELPEIICVADIAHHKNQNKLILALDELAREIKFRVLFLGRSNNKNAYYLDFLNLVEKRPWCSYIGYTDLPALKQYLARAALLVLPSLEDNCPMVILEAMAAGLPVAASNMGGIPDLIDDGVTGVIFDPLDSISIRESISKILRNKALAQRMSLNSKSRALSNHHPDVIAQRHLEIYKTVLSN